MLAGVEGVTEVYSVSGEWDLVAIVRVPQYDDIAHVVTEIFPRCRGSNGRRRSRRFARTPRTICSRPGTSASSSTGQPASESMHAPCLIAPANTSSGLFAPEDELLASLREEADRTGLPPIADLRGRRTAAPGPPDGDQRATGARGRHARRLLGDLDGAGAAAGWTTALDRDRAEARRVRAPIRRARRAGRASRDPRRPRARRAAEPRRRAVRRRLPRRRQGAAADVLRVGSSARAPRRPHHRRQRALGRPGVRRGVTTRRPRPCASSTDAWQPIRASSRSSSQRTTASLSRLSAERGHEASVIAAAYSRRCGALSRAQR